MGYGNNVLGLPNSGAPSVTIEVFNAKAWAKIVFAQDHFLVQLELSTHKVVQEIAMISKSQLNHLVQTGAIVPHNKQSGRVGRSSYGYQNTLEAFLCHELRRSSINTANIRNIAKWIRGQKWCFTFDSEVVSDMHADVLLDA